jgi:beta-aspartyl-dipeptidase (metallo-type)
MLFIRNATVYAPQPLGLCNLLVGGGKILWIGGPAELPELPSALRAAAETLDLDGARLIPGLIDAHVHVTGGGGEAGFHTRVPPVPLTLFTMSGVTSVVGLLGTDDVARGSGELLANIYALR